MKKIALVTGITGQCGSYLAELLLNKDYEVHGLVRRASTFNTDRINHIYQDPHNQDVRLHLHYGDLTDGQQMSDLVYQLKPDIIFNCAAQSHVRVSFDTPCYTFSVTGGGIIPILEAVKLGKLRTRIVQFSSSEMFGSSPAPQNENTLFQPRSPYAVAKLAAYWLVKNYREAYDMFAANVIMFNTESPRRGETFVTRKVTKAVARVKAGMQKYLYLGNLDAKRDWSYVPDNMEAVFRISQHSCPDDFVIGTGEMHSVREFVEEAFSYANLDWKEYVRIDERYFRPTEVDELCADATKAKNDLKWYPKTKFKDLVHIMVDADMEAVK